MHGTVDDHVLETHPAPRCSACVLIPIDRTQLSQRTAVRQRRSARGRTKTFEGPRQSYNDLVDTADGTDPVPCAATSRSTAYMTATVGRAHQSMLHIASISLHSGSSNTENFWHCDLSPNACPSRRGQLFVSASCASAIVLSIFSTNFRFPWRIAWSRRRWSFITHSARSNISKHPSTGTTSAGRWSEVQSNSASQMGSSFLQIPSDGGCFLTTTRTRPLGRCSFRFDAASRPNDLREDAFGVWIKPDGHLLRAEFSATCKLLDTGAFSFSRKRIGAQTDGAMTVC
mmetsp:Transcript_7795/g.21362  ORF Transcript_7795/g.21362 Transcript_7795/m.21362 type:complete len:286 (-) Transcript_7795:19-876(-)